MKLKSIVADKKGASGLVTGLIFSVVMLALGLIVAFIFLSTIIDANLLTGNYKGVVDNLTINLTQGTHAVVGKIPTILVVASIVLILGVLALLPVIMQRFNFGGASSL